MDLFLVPLMDHLDYEEKVYAKGFLPNRGFLPHMDGNGDIPTDEWYLILMSTVPLVS